MMRPAGTALLIAVAAYGAAWAQEDSTGERFSETRPPEVELTDLPLGEPDPNEERLSGIGNEMARQRADRGETAGQEGLMQDEPAQWWLFGRGALALCIVLAMILVAYYLLNRFGGRTPLLAGAKLGTIMGRVALSPKAYLYFVRTADRVLVVGWTPTSINRVAEYDVSEFREFLESETEGGGAQRDLGPTLRSDFRETLSSQTLEERMIELDAGSLDATQDDLALDMSSLRGEIEQLRAYVRESSRDD